MSARNEPEAKAEATRGPGGTRAESRLPGHPTELLAFPSPAAARCPAPSCVSHKLADYVSSICFIGKETGAPIKPKLQP